MQKKLIVILVLAALLAGCAPSQSPVDIQSQVDAAVAQTMEAQQQISEFVALTVAAQVPASTPTAVDTALPVATFAPIVIPTDTPLPTFPPVEDPTDTAIPPVVQPTYACDVFTVKPDYQEDIKAGSKFDIRWIIVNTGSRTWAAGTDVKYSNGWEMTGVKTVEIPKAMKPNDRYTINLDAVAPSQKGHQYMTWAVDGQLCYPSIIINVK